MNATASDNGKKEEEDKAARIDVLEDELGVDSFELTLIGATVESPK